MVDFVHLENYIAEFVDRHVAEKVKLSIRQKTVAIQPIKKKGSILLSIFWIKVLQHKNNFPTQCVSYNKKKVSDSELIFLLVDDIMISLDLLSGVFTVQGDGALEWFRTKMLQVMRNYSGCRKDDSEYRTSMRSYVGPTSIHETMKSTILEDDHLSKLMVETVLDAACECASSSSLKPSRSWIYRFWKSLLYRWLAEPSFTVVVASSRLDSDRLRDLADISLLQRATAQVQAIYVPIHCDQPDKNHGSGLSLVKRDCLAGYNSSEQLWIEYELLNKIVVPRNGIGCNFIAAVMPNNRVQLMLTSCRFHAADFCRDSLHSVHFMELSEIQFDRDYIAPLHQAL